MQAKKPTNAIIILDGYGLQNPQNPTQIAQNNANEIAQIVQNDQNATKNAIKSAKTPYLDHLFATCPHSTLNASGADVGLPDGQMGNSEVGHLNLGAGRIIYQDITAISNSITDGTFFKNPTLKKAMDNAKNKALHLCGLISDGGVHSTLSHLNALIKMAKAEGVERIFIHCITDGRDTAPTSAIGFIDQIENECKTQNAGKIATIVGRFYIMDRDNRWDRVKIGYDCVFNGVGQKFDTAKSAVESLYGQNLTDEFLTPCIIGDYSGFGNNDSFIFFNFRADRAREIAKSATQKDFDLFERGQFKNPLYVGFTLYDTKLDQVLTAFKPKEITNTLGNWLSANNLSQARVAETEKYAHVTFFFNGGVEAPDKGEIRHLIPSPNVKTYDTTPQMSAPAVAQKATEQVGVADVLIVNFANCDMVGHTGDFDATVRAVECVDQCLKTVVDAVLASDGFAIVVADHGNAEIMTYPDGSPMTAHTSNPVPMILVGKGNVGLKNGRLADVAPTFLSLIGLAIPDEMTGKNLIVD